METILCPEEHKSDHNFKQTYFDKYGYLRFIHNKKLVHRIILEKALGETLEPDEVVHHINENKFDNRPENLKRCKNRLVHHRFLRKNNNTSDPTQSHLF